MDLGMIVHIIHPATEDCPVLKPLYFSKLLTCSKLGTILRNFMIFVHATQLYTSGASSSQGQWYLKYCDWHWPLQTCVCSSRWIRCPENFKGFVVKSEKCVGCLFCRVDRKMKLGTLEPTWALCTSRPRELHTNFQGYGCFNG